MAHLKRLVAPKTWPIKRKETVFVTHQYPRAKTERSLPLSIILRDLLKVGNTTKEIRRILREKQLLVNGKVETNHRFAAAILDIIEIPKIGKTYLVTFNKLGKICLAEIKKPSYRVLRIEGKTKQAGGKAQLNLFNGANVLAEKDDYKVGDAVKISIPEGKLTGKISPAEGTKVLVVGGAHIGETATIKSLMLSKKPKEVMLANEAGEFRTIFENIHIIE